MRAFFVPAGLAEVGVAVVAGGAADIPTRTPRSTVTGTTGPLPSSPNGSWRDDRPKYVRYN